MIICAARKRHGLVTIFFFQAEDGIRDRNVTGVQTCALPISLGLMQIMPRLWAPNLGPVLGRNLKDDETNLRYGVYILRHFAKHTADTLDARNVIKTALLGYNGDRKSVV